jgi:hypothetical protein
MSAFAVRDEIVDFLTLQVAVADPVMYVLVRGVLNPVIEIEKERGCKIDVYPLTTARARLDRGSWQVTYTIRVVTRTQTTGRTETETTLAEQDLVGLSEWVQNNLMFMKFEGPYGISSMTESNTVEREAYEQTHQLISVLDVQVVSYVES